ncbi:MAG TPA: hypothetical protein VGJ66_23515, partial [Pyrinomonadaceae bacterium]
MKRQARNSGRLSKTQLHSAALTIAKSLRPASYYLKTLIQAGLILLSLYATPGIQAQTCDAIPNPGTESISAHITRKDTNVTVTDGMV